MKPNLSLFSSQHFYRNFLLFLFVSFAACFNNVRAQVGTPTYFNIVPTTATNAFPLNTTASNKVLWVIPPSAFSTNGTGTGTYVGAGNNITKLYIRIATANATTVYPGFQISMGQNGTTIGSFTAGAGQPYLTTLTPVVTSSGFQFTGITANSWYGITLPTPFTYDPTQSLYIEIKSNLGVAGGNAVNSITQTGINSRIFGAYAATTGTGGTGTTPFGIDVVPAAACSAPPTAGTATSTLSTVCSAQATTLNLTGSSTGSGLSYQWESASAIGGPYTPIAATSTVYSQTVNPTTSTYYRCQVTCSGSTVASTPVFVTVAPTFPGGTYTINSALPTGGSNFQTFNDAVSAISCGISSPIVFNVDPASGPYNEQITLPSTIGATALNTVTFNGNGRTLQFASTNSNARHVIKLNGADYITFNELNINASGGTYGWGIHFTNGADYNTVNLCTITTSITDATSGNFQPVVMSNDVASTTAAGNNGSNNTFQDNTLIGGYYAVTLCGFGPGTENTGNYFNNNVMRDFYSYGVYMTYQKGSTISSCDLSRPNRTASTATAGVFMTTGAFGNLVENNRIHNYFDAMTTNTSTMYGVYEAANGTATDITRVINNVIYNINSSGSVYGIYNTTAAYENIYHNTISLDYTAATAGLAYGVYQTGSATNINVRNNVITISKGGTGAKVGLFYATAASGIVSNNNVVYLNSAGTGAQSYGTSVAVAYATLANWQTANGGVYDANSVQANPVYTSAGTGDFTPTSILTNNIGFNVGVPFDINGNPRSATPDPGAYEYNLVGLDAGITWVSPTSPTTTGLKTITVNIANNLSTTITDLVLSYTDGVTPVTQTFTGLNLLPAASQLFSFTTQYNMIGNVAMRAYINSVNGILDNVQLNDTTNVQNLCVSMSGAYTVNAGAATSATNFQSFSALAATLSCGGITGPVTVNVVAGSGPYNEQVSFGVIPGSSFANTVTINGNNNTLTYPSGTEYFTLRLNGADNMTWNNLNIATTGTTNGFALNMSNASDFNNFNNCTFSVPISATSTTTSCVAFSASSTAATTAGNNGNNNTFTGCTMTGGYYCISVYGNSTGNIVGNTFVNCNIREYYVYGLYNVYGGTTIIRDCIFERPTRANVSTGYSMYLSTGSTSCLIERNRVRNLFGGAPTSTSACYALACIVSATAGNENKFINNLVSDINSSGTIYGLYLSGAGYVQAYHNTISLDQTAATGTTTTYGVYATGTAGVDIRNNLVSLTRGGAGTKYCAYYSTIAGVTSNYNDFYLNSAAGTNYMAYDGVTSFATLPAYQIGNPTKDQQSVSILPSFNNPGIQNYQPTEATLDNLGTNVGVTIDITSTTRGTTPDIGSYEFSVAATDAGMFAFNSPGTSGCYSSTENIIATIKNYGANTIDFSINPLTVTCDVTGAATATLTATPTGTLAPGATMNVTLSPSLNMTANGTYNLNMYTTMTGDGNSANDVLNPSVSRIVGPVGGTITSNFPSICVSGTPLLTLSGSYGGAIQWKESTVSATGPWTNVGTGTTTYTPSTPVTQTTYYLVEVSCNGNISQSNTLNLVVNNPTLLGTTPATRCGVGTVTLGASVSPGNTANWYANATGGLPLGSGTSFTTPTISSTTNFYVAATSGGLTTNVGRASDLTPSDSYNTGTNTVGIQFDAVSALTINSVLVYPYSATAGTAGSITIGLQSSAGVTLQTATVSVIGNPTPVGQVVNLNFNVSPGTGYRLLWMTPNVGITGLYREYTATPFNFPYTVPGVISLTSSYTSGASLAYYYYFYNWSISTGCEGTRTAVAATVTTPPALTASAVDPILCPGNSTTISVSSPNDPDYTYNWTASPGTYTATGAGPHTISPTTTTIYTVTATDNTSGPNAGCANVATVTVVTAPAVVAGTVSTPINSYCVTGSPLLTLTGSAGGAIQWQSSTVSNAGPWTNVGSGAATYSPGAVTQTTYYQAQVSCGATTVYSNVLTVTVTNPQVLTTTPGSRCGPGTVVLGATVEPGATAKWYAAPTGGSSLGTGTSFTTPTIASTTSFYVEPVLGLGGADSVAVPLATGSTTGVYHHMFAMTSPTGMTLNAIGIKCNNAVGTLTAWDVYYRPDNYQLTPGSNLSATGWTLLTSATNVSSLGATDYTYISIGNNLTIPPGQTYSFYVAPVGTATHQYGTTAAGTTVVSNANATIIAGHRGSTLFNCNTASGIAVVKMKYSLGCIGTRVPVLATINTPPAMTVSAVDPTLCPGGTTSVSVSSANPNYTYTWTSNPAGFTSTGAGPFTISPTITTKYYVSAIDNSTGTFAGCSNLDSVTVITAATLSAGTVSSSVGTICISGIPTLTVTGTSGGAIQWQESTTSATGPWNNVGSGGTSFTPGAAITQTTYYRVEVSCQTTSVQSNVVTVTVNNPLIVTTNPGVICGTSGSATISATASAGADIKWYNAATGGTALATGSSYTTPVISATTTYYAEPNIGGAGGTASPIQVTEMDLGTNDQLEIQNVSPDPIDVTGWKVAVSNSYTDITSVNANVQVLSGIMAPGAIMKWTDATAGPNYWGSNILWNPGAFPTYSGWAAVLDNNNVLKDIVFINWPSASISSASITVGTTVITVGSQWSGNGIDATTVAATNSLSRQGTSDNNNATDFGNIALSMNSTNPGMTLPFSGFGCVGSRVPVAVTVGPCNSTLNLTCLIQGYWDGTSMLPVLANQFEPTTTGACDSIDVELRDEFTYAVAASVRTVLQQNGTATCVFPPVSGNYYIALKHRNAIQTWSASPVTFGSTPVSYDFTTAANQAYGDNQIEVSVGVWALYSGDIITDENMDLLDINAVETDISAFGSGYLPTDINGDGNVDLLDSPPVEANISSFIFSNHP